MLMLREGFEVVHTDRSSDSILRNLFEFSTTSLNGSSSTNSRTVGTHSQPNAIGRTGMTYISSMLQGFRLG